MLIHNIMRQRSLWPVTKATRLHVVAAVTMLLFFRNANTRHRVITIEHDSLCDILVTLGMVFKSVPVIDIVDRL